MAIMMAKPAKACRSPCLRARHSNQAATKKPHTLETNMATSNINESVKL
jgi:hypothetical protein